MESETIRRLARSQLTADTVLVAVRLLANTNANGYGRLGWDEFAALVGITHHGAARRHLTRLKQADVLTYSTNGYVEWSICAANDAPVAARNAPVAARGDDDQYAARAGSSALRAGSSASDVQNGKDGALRAPVAARNAPVAARNAPVAARGDDDLIDDLILDRWIKITNRSAITEDERNVLIDAGDLVGKLLAQLATRWTHIKAKSNVAGYMRSILTTLRNDAGAAHDDDFENSEAAAASRRRRYIPKHLEHIIIG